MFYSLQELVVVFIIVIFPVGLFLKTLYLVRLLTEDYSNYSREQFSQIFYFFKIEDEVVFWSLWNLSTIGVFLYALFRTVLYIEIWLGMWLNA